MRLHTTFLFAALLAAAAFALSVGATAQEGSPASAAPPDDLETVFVTAPPDPDAERLAAVENFLEGLTSLKSRFMQQSPDGSLLRGTLHLSRPGRIRFEYDDDVPILVVSDGQTLNLIDYEVGQVTRWPIKDTPLGYLVAENVDFSGQNVVVAAGPGQLANMISVTAQDPKRPDQGTMTLIFSSAPGDGDGAVGQLELRAWQVIDSQGGMTTVTLTQTETGLQMAESLWRFDDPRGERFRRRRR